MAPPSLKNLMLCALLLATVVCAVPVDSSTNHSTNNSNSNSTSVSNSNSNSESNSESNSNSVSNSNSNSVSDSNSNSTSSSNPNPVSESNSNSTSNSNPDSNSNSNPNSNPDANDSCTVVSTKLNRDCFLIDPNAVLVNKNSTSFVKGLIQCPCSPTKRGSTQNATLIFDDIRKLVADTKKKAIENIFSTTGDIIEGLSFPEKLKHDFDMCTQHNRLEACVNADSALRGKGVESICTYDSKTGKNLYNNGTKVSPTFVTLAGCDKNSQYAFEPTVNEGCVAVEHLRGYVLQHARHLLRPVLCANDFCATPNHAIIVKGETTSMKQLCGSGRWQCTRSVKLVNNLKISANRRAKISDDIVVTPYDVRFPKALIWIVQMAEDVWNVLALSLCTGTLAGAAVLLIAKAESN